MCRAILWNMRTEDAAGIITLHVASGDLWAGAEVQVYAILAHWARSRDITPIAVLLNDGELARRLRDSGVRVFVLDETRLSTPQITLRLTQLLREIRPHVVHTHRQKENICGAIANALATKAVSVRTTHGAPERQPTGLRNLHRRILRGVDQYCGSRLQRMVIAVSAPLSIDLARQFGAPHVRLIENGVDIEGLRAQAEAAEFRAAHPDATHVGIVGRLEPVKRVDLFLETCAYLQQHAPHIDWRFHVIGDGSLRAALQARARELALGELVTFHGHRLDSARCLASLDVLLMCSDHEGMPMTPLEALAVGTPVVAHAVGGLRDILAGDAAGQLVESHTAPAYGQALLKLLAKDRAALRQAGLARVRERFSVERTANQTAALYRELLGSD